MAMKGSVSFIEQHVEKGVLGIAVLFMLGLGVFFLGLGPNKVEYGGQKVTPRELDEAILRQAQGVQQAYKNAQPKAEPVPTYAAKLRQQFEAGIFGTDPNLPPLPRELRVVAQFGQPLPSSEAKDDTDRDVTLVTPLKPHSLVARTGISLVLRQPATLPGEEPAAGAPPDADEPSELSWVSVGAYFPLEAEQRDMIKAGYAGHRAKVYLVGVDVQRQEMTASGEFGDWVDVEPSRAMPKLEIPDPVYDNKTGELLNQAELDQKFALVAASQQQLIQSAYYLVTAGDQWEIPPLPGHEPKEEEVDEGAAKPVRDPNKPQPGVQKPPPPPPPAPTGGGRMGPAGGGGGRGGIGGGGRGGRGGIGGGAPAPAPGAQQPPPRSDEAKENLRQARAAREKKEWEEVLRLAQAVENSAEATTGEKSQAARLVKEAEKAIAAATRIQHVAQREPLEFVKNPSGDNEPAVWTHDDSVQPGKTYRYRMRVKVWNRYVGRKSALRDPAQADRTVLEGEWSLPSLPITVAPKQHFFVRSQAFGEPAASVDVFTWHKGTWRKEDFKVRVGDVIGGPVEAKSADAGKETVDFSTHALVLDLRTEEPVVFRRAAGKEGEFAYRDAKSLVLTYLDPADGQVKERIADVDRVDPLYKKLKDEAESAKGG